MDGFKGKKILITGGLGFIGSNLAHSLKGEGAEVTILDNFDHESGSNSFNISNIESDIEILKEDIINYDTVLDAVKGKDIVFNAAASTSHSISMKKPWENLRTNTLGVLNILESIKTLEPNISFVHIGTTTQIGPMRSSPSDELHPEFPTDMYSANKVVGEKYTLLYAKAYGLRCCVVRLPNVYGPRAAIHSPNFTFNNFFIGLALQKKKITVFKPGDQLRNIIFVDDAVNALNLACLSENSQGETFIASSDDHFSVKEIAEKTAEVIGGGVSMLDWPEDRETIEVGDAVFTNKKIKSILGWKTSVDLEEGLKITKDYYSQCLEYYLND